MMMTKQEAIEEIQQMIIKGKTGKWKDNKAMNRKIQALEMAVNELTISYTQTSFITDEALKQQNERIQNRLQHKKI